MRCLYCEVEVTQYPDSGICPRCGGRLPPRPPVQESQSVYPPVPMGYTRVPPMYRQQPFIYTEGINCCPKCHSNQLMYVNRGFSWLWAIVGFFFVPFFGLLFGFCGRKNKRLKCTACGHRWKP